MVRRDTPEDRERQAALIAQWMSEPPIDAPLIDDAAGGWFDLNKHLDEHIDGWRTGCHWCIDYLNSDNWPSS